MERYNKIYPKRKSARMIASDFHKNTGKKIEPEFVHWLAKRFRFEKHPYGKEVYYASNLRDVLDANYYTLYPVFLKEKEQKKLEREKPRNIDYDPNKWIEGDTRPRFYTPTDESIDRHIDNVINEVIKRRKSC